MKTKKFLMTTLLVMGMVIAKAANGFPPELVLVSQPVLTYNANSVTVYYDVQNIGDYTYKGNIYVYLDPDDGYYFARKWVRVCPGRIRRVAITIPIYHMNLSWVYTVMPYYELDNELYSFTVFEYFEPLRFHWYGYRNEPWVVINVGPRPRHYVRPYPYRYYYDGFRPFPPPPPGGYPHGYFDGMAPLNPAHHTYGYHHNTGGYPANYHPANEVPGYNPGSDHEAPSASVRRSGSSNNSSHSMSSSESNITPSNNSSNSMSGRSNNTGTSSSSNNSNSSSGRSGNSDSGRSGNSDSGRSGSTSSGRTDSGNVSRPSSDSGRTGTSTSGRSGSTSTSSTSSRDNNRSSGRSGNSTTSSSSRSDNRSSGTSSNSSSGRSSGTGSGPSSSGRPSSSRSR